ncbi:hypothetical protein [Vacuolonema iberomarrocanum]|uniref:hypothetical protein n=1 Tax=Vacuolonema iberomarrocanum TaxID=3454632 RepID=UPI0019DD80C6|nr:hypothetical protein [filamentous cyanobacterium LEGE 07170]
MARRIDQIEKDLTTLEEAMGAIATDLEIAYESYLADLATITSQQLVLAAYHLCTQGYPEEFLALSASQREETQQALRSLAQGAKQQLHEALSPKPSDPDPDPSVEAAEPLTSAVVLDAQGTMHEEAAIAPPPESTESNEDPVNLASQPLPALSPEDDLYLPAEPSSAEPSSAEPSSAEPSLAELTSSESSSANPDLTEANIGLPGSTEDISGEDLSLAERSKSIADTEGTVILQLGDLSDDEDDEESALSILPSDPLNRLVKWHERVEGGMSNVLQTLSYEANRLLHRVKILPHNLPDPVLEVAIKSGMTAESAGSPNLMKLMIEAKSEDRDDSGILQFIIIRLRLSELEFGNPSLSSQRSQMRQLLSRLKKIGKDYRKRQREKTTAQAELAWRSTWHEG